MKQTPVYVLDLTKINGRGDFPCPKCGVNISPNVCTEEVYTIVEAKVKNQSLDKLKIRCNRCKSYLHLTGFSLLQRLFERELNK